MDNQEELGISLVIHGHDHVSSIEWINKTLWVEIHNTFEPSKYEPTQGYRIFEMEQPSKLIVDEKSYSYDFPDIDYPDPVSTTVCELISSSDTLTSNTTDTPWIFGWLSLPLYVIIMINLKHKNEK